VILHEAQSHVGEIQYSITAELANVVQTLKNFRAGHGTDDPVVRAKLLEHFSDRQDQLHHLFPSPYFFRCDVRGDDGKQTLFVSKFSLIDRSVYSWTTPVARLRFANIGPASYSTPKKGEWCGEVTRKDQFMIVGGKIVFLTSEDKTAGRTLVYQEKLSNRKVGFILPEIVERMERAQDDVIRAPSDGPFLISGPAGSGKTTLAFHRLAYLLQSPETAERFSAQNVIVFVQDEGTRAYFSQLLPDLGIHNVHVTTFDAWAMDILDLQNVTFIRRPNGIDETIDLYEHDKLIAMKQQTVYSSHKKPFVLLEDIYAETFSKEDTQIFRAQKDLRQLDRFDLSILLHARLQEGPLLQEKEYFSAKKNFEIQRKTKKVPVQYNLIVVDEAQNYLPEQLTLLRSCASPDTQGMLYVGDLGQQVLLGTLRDWSSAGENISTDRKVELDKVYRSTQQILQFIQNQGFTVSIPEGLREGKTVVEKTFENLEQELLFVQTVVKQCALNIQIGILSTSSSYLDPYRKAFAQQSNVHILTMHESQGVEFETVILVGHTEMFFAKSTNPALTEELGRIKRDLFYVALTRAMDELFVFSVHR